MIPLLVTSGEPAGVGPDICLDLTASKVPLVIVADKMVLAERAQQLGRTIQFDDYIPGKPIHSDPHHLTVLHLPCSSPVTPGKLNPQNSAYVIEMLTIAVDGCLQKRFAGMVTAPVHKGVINDFGYAFTGHTEFIAHRCGVETVVMMLVCQSMRVALVTTHLPLREVVDAISQSMIMKVIHCLHQSLKQMFAIQSPKIWMAGLNPHAGEGGHLGREEIDIIAPAIAQLRQQGLDVEGPFPADTLFSPKANAACDVYVAMYHDQGLPVLKYAGFGQAVNVTLGLPIIRTSVDHGTALALAGTGQVVSTSLLSAIDVAEQMVNAQAGIYEN
jgi:4-hydroxythreonine-4-phosphate dehydrogenase